MAIVGAIVGVVGSLFSGASSLDSAENARYAAELGSRSILDETATNIAQEKRAQNQTYGIAKASAAASGIKFNAAKIDAVKFSEGGYTLRTENRSGWRVSQFMPQNESKKKSSYLVPGLGVLFGGKDRWTESYKDEKPYGQQVAGDTTGGSSFTYLREMKKTFAKDIGWMGKQGRARAEVAKQGGQVAYAQGRAAAVQSGAQAFQQAYSWWQSKE